MNQKKLCKRNQGKMVDGVCGGISDYLGLDVTLIRIAWALLTCFTAGFGGVLAYVICAMVMPRETDIW